MSLTMITIDKLLEYTINSKYYYLYGTIEDKKLFIGDTLFVDTLDREGTVIETSTLRDSIIPVYIEAFDYIHVEMQREDE